MILRLRHAVPFLQKLNGWTAGAPVPVLSRHFARAAAAVASTTPDDVPEGSDASVTGGSAEPKTKRRATRAKADADAQTAAAEVEVSGDSGTSSPSTTKRRTKSSRKAANTSGAEEEQQQPPGGEADTVPVPARRSRKKTVAGAAAAEPGFDETAPPSTSGATGSDGGTKRRSTTRKKAGAAKAEEGVATAEAAAEGGILQADGMAVSTSGGATDSDDGNKKRGGGGGRKKGVTNADGAAATEIATDSNWLQKLPFEDCLVLPRKAEQVMEAMGIRVIAPDRRLLFGSPGAAAPAATGPAAAAAGDAAGSIPGPGRVHNHFRNVQELAHYLGGNTARDMATPLLLSFYQGYLGSPDHLYDLFMLDFDSCLASDQVKQAAVEASQAARSVLSAGGKPTESVIAAARERLLAMDRATVKAQDAKAPGLTEAQLELFVLDWASASVAGVSESTSDIQYTARRCAVLQLTRQVQLDRLYRYAVEGASVQELTRVESSKGAAKQVKLMQPMEALTEGLKAGVRLGRDRLIADFRLGEGQPLHDHIPDLQQEVMAAAAASSDPGSRSFYVALYEKLRLRAGLAKAIQAQERQWALEQGDQGDFITTAQLRLLFHLGRLELFREEQRERERQLAAGLGAAAGTPQPSWE